MFGKNLFTVLILAIGLTAGFALNYILTTQPVFGKESGKILVQGHGRANSSLKPPGEQFKLFAENEPGRFFEKVPTGKKFVLTDVMYIAQKNVRENIVVNIANSQGSILFQVNISPEESDEVHFCSGYVISAGATLEAWTNADLKPGQYVSISVTGYLVDE